MNLSFAAPGMLAPAMLPDALSGATEAGEDPLVDAGSPTAVSVLLELDLYTGSSS